ncbi:hypothetical protein ACWEWX_50060, partial [Streptomyces asiaticus]
QRLGPRGPGGRGAPPRRPPPPPPRPPRGPPGAVVRQTGVPAEVALVVERQADPYREQPLAARIVRAVNAYTELVSGPAAEGGAAGVAALRALERLRLATARDFDPVVVEALATVLARGVYGRPR